MDIEINNNNLSLNFDTQKINVGTDNGVGKKYIVDGVEKGEIFNDYENNKAISENSHAEGYKNIAGTKCFTITDWNETNKSYTLDSVEGLTDGDRLSMEWIESYSDYGAIVSIDSITNTITVDNFIIGSSSDESVEKKLFVHNKPWLGTHSYGYGTHTEGADNIALLTCSHAEGRGNKSLGFYAHTEGRNNVASYTSHAEGKNNFAIGDISHAEGRYTKALGYHSHAEGNGDEQNYVMAVGNASHAEGKCTRAIGDYSHAEGAYTIASETQTHAEGYGTKASSSNQHVQGKFNIEDKNNKYAHIVGNGEKEDDVDGEGNLIKQNRSNAHTIDWNGNGWFAGALTMNGNKTVASTEYVDNLIGDIESILNEVV